MNRLFLLLLCVCGYTNSTLGQHRVSPTVPDFTDIKADWVVATYGGAADPYQDTGIIDGRHTLITKQGTDPFTGDILKFLPEGESKVIRLGNPQIDAEAESLSYSFIVDPEKPVLLLKFAVVFQDPSHDKREQPRFVVRIKDATGKLIEDCALYDVSARGDIEGFQSYRKLGVPIRWRDWTNVGLDMSRLAGKEVQVQLTTYDCAQYAHFGYAYFTATCISNKLSMSNCSGNDFVLSAPDGFAAYKWHNGATTASTAWTIPEEGNMNISCEVISATGCRFVLGAYVSAEGDIPTESRIYYDTICEGDVYVDNFYELPPQEKIGTFVYYNTFFDQGKCKGDITSTLFLTVCRRFFQFNAQICYGEDYLQNGFTIRQPSAGVHYDTLCYISKVGCDSIVALELRVSHAFTQLSGIDGPKEPCMGERVTYSVPENENINTFRWELPNGFYVEKGAYSSQVTALVTDRADMGQLSLYAANGCGDGRVTLDLAPQLAYWKTVNDTLCLGEEYHENDFNIPAQHHFGDYTFAQVHKTTFGCDSAVMLFLHILEKPVIELECADDVICAGESITLKALRVVDSSFREKIAHAGDAYTKAVRTTRLISDSTLTYQWNTGETTPDITVSPYSATEYSVVVTSSEGCSGKAQKQIFVASGTDVKLTDSICKGERYQKNGFDLSEAGHFSKILEGSGGCNTRVELDLKVINPDTTNLYATICDGKAYSENNFLEWNAGIYTQRWSKMNACDSVVSLDLKVQSLHAETYVATICSGETYTDHGFNASVGGTYTQTLTTSFGCDSIVTLILNVVPHFDGTIISSLEDCLTRRYLFSVLPDPEYTVSFFWDFGDGSTSTLSRPVHNYADSGIYRISLTILSDDYACKELLYSDLRVPYFEDVFDIYSNRRSVSSLFPTILFWTKLVTGMRYEWDLDDGVRLTDDKITHTYRIGDRDYYDVRLTVTDAGDCISERMFRLPVDKELDPPNTFSPNSDGTNDIFMKGYRLRILNRNGVELYNGEEGWDGSYKDKQVPEDTYFYELYYPTDRGDRKITGYITLVR